MAPEAELSRAVGILRSRSDSALGIEPGELIGELLEILCCSFEHARSLILSATTLGMLQLTPSYRISIPG